MCYGFNVELKKNISELVFWGGYFMLQYKERILRQNEIETLFPEISGFLVDNNLNELECGKYELDKGIYVNIDTYTTKSSKDRLFESHRKYLDLQILISGEERIAVCERDKLHFLTTYDSQKDIQFYSSCQGVEYRLTKETGILLYPNNAHKPCIFGEEDKPAFVKKAVFKIPITYGRKIKCVFMDVDGTLTDGKIYMGNTGEMIKAFNIKDGYGLSTLLKEHNILPIIITGRESQILLNRCVELGIENVFQGVEDKSVKVKEIIKNLQISLKQVAYIGDDLNDWECMKMIGDANGILACPRNAAEKIKESADYICEHDGGDGAVRDFIDWLIN